METQERQRAEAAAALKQIADSRAALAERLSAPWWYYLAGGAVAGGCIAQMALPAFGLLRIPLLLALVLVGGWLLPRAYRNVTGFSVVGPPGARSRRWLFALVFVAVAVWPAGAALQAVWGWVGPVLAGIFTVPVITVVLRRYDAAVRTDVRERA